MEGIKNSIDAWIRDFTRNIQDNYSDQLNQLAQS